jgi:SOS-response transcriptional repressor LexA
MKELEKKNIAAENLGITIEKLIKLQHTNMHKLHKKTGVPLTTINRLINDKNVNPTISSLIPIADFFDVSLNQLMGIDPLESDSLVGKYIKKQKLWTEIPIISWEDAIQWPLNSLNISIEKVISTDILLNANSYALIIIETNWEGFFPNSILIIDSVVTPEHGDYVIIWKIGQKIASLKQVLMDDDKVYLRPVNKDYQTQLLNESYKILGVISQIRMDRK